MTRTGRPWWGAVAVSGALALGVAACGSEDTPDGRVLIAAGRREAAPPLSGQTLGGESFNLVTLRGRVVVLNVWGSWCAPCRKEAPYLQAAWDQTRTLGDVQFLGLNTRDDAAGAAEAFERRFGITYPSLRDNDGSLQLVFRSTLPPQAIPSTIVLDRQGRVAARIIGEGSRGTFVSLVDQIRSEA